MDEEILVPKYLLTALEERIKALEEIKYELQFQLYCYRSPTPNVRHQANNIKREQEYHPDGSVKSMWE